MAEEQPPWKAAQLRAEAATMKSAAAMQQAEAIEQRAEVQGEKLTDEDYAQIAALRATAA